MIPKKIHYIWLGQGKKSNLSHICINSWREKLPDYEIIEWNENNLPLDEIAKNNRYFKECMERKLYAFMADFLRLYVLDLYGGIYFDTDVQVLQTFDDLLNVPAFIGYEAYGKFLGSGIIGAEAGNPMIKKILEFYSIDVWNEKIYTIPAVLNHVFEYNPQLCKYVKIYPKEYFAPYDYHKEFDYRIIESNTYSIHWFDGSWKDNLQVRLFLQTKHIKNPIKKKLMKIKKILGFYYHKIHQ